MELLTLNVVGISLVLGLLVTRIAVAASLVDSAKNVYDNRHRSTIINSEAAEVEGGVSLVESLLCYIGALSQQFDGAQLDRYDEFFREDSVLILAQTGEYRGPDDIKEYSGFATELFSPYIASNVESNETPRLVNYDRETCICEFVALSQNTYGMDPSTTRDDSEFNVVSMTKVFYNLEENYIARAHVYFAPAFIEFFFGELLNSDNTRNYVCSVLRNACSAVPGIDPGVDCEGTLAALDPVTDTLAYVDGNSQGCRALHASFAAMNADDHCPHVSFTPFADPKGRFKCQSSDGITAAELFTTLDFAIFEEYARGNDIDPQKGYSYCASNDMNAEENTEEGMDCGT